MAHKNNPLRNKNNEVIFNKVRAELGMSFQSRVPAATKGAMSKTLRDLTKPGANGLMNQFIDAFVNRIGSIIASTDAMWENPLAAFKRSPLEFGSTIEEYAVGLLNAYVYDDDRERLERDVWGTELPPVETIFHTVNRREFYKVSVRENSLRQAFLEPNGLADLVESIMAAPIKSNNWDEFMLTMQLIPEYEKNGGFHHLRIPHVSDLDSTRDDAAAALRRMRALTGNLQFLSTKYNAANMPVHARPEDLVILTTPEFQAAVDVEALAGAFNPSKMDTEGRVITVPRENFNIDHCEAIVTTRDFFVIANQLKENRSIENPAAMQNNYFFHNWQVISASKFVPAVMFSTKYDDEVIHVQSPVTGISAITFEPAEDGTEVTNVTRGGTIQLVAKATNAEGTALDGIMWSVLGNTSVQTFVTPTGVLHCAGNEEAETVTVAGRTSWVDPANPYGQGFVATKAVPVVGDVAPEWPADHTELHADDTP